MFAIQNLFVASMVSKIERWCLRETFPEKGVLINGFKVMSGLGTVLKGLVYLSNTSVIFLLFCFFVLFCFCRHASHSGLGEPLP